MARETGFWPIPVAILLFGGFLGAMFWVQHSETQAVQQAFTLVHRPFDEASRSLVSDPDLADLRHMGLPQVHPDPYRSGHTTLWWGDASSGSCIALAEAIARKDPQTQDVAITINGRHQSNLDKPDGFRTPCQTFRRHARMNIQISLNGLTDRPLPGG